MFANSRKERLPFEIPELSVDNKFPIEACEVADGALHLCSVAINVRSVHEGGDGVDLLPLQCLFNIRPEIEGTGSHGAEKGHAVVHAVCLRR